MHLYSGLIFFVRAAAEMAFFFYSYITDDDL